ncbi:hypothetical protein TNCV_1338951 [Trichonephila clavipes]|nr:hypothetical protein TNCV_1338951 [Trichonephila clavipes]
MGCGLVFYHCRPSTFPGNWYLFVLTALQCRRIPIAAGNFDAQFRPQRKAPETCFQVILRGSSQLTQDTTVLINRIAAAQRTCILQRIPAHVDIFGNEQADKLAKEVQNFPQPSNDLTLTEADAISRCKLAFKPVKKHLIPENCNHEFCIDQNRRKSEGVNMVDVVEHQNRDPIAFVFQGLRGSALS